MSAVQSASTFRVEVAASQHAAGYRVNRLYFLQGAPDKGISAEAIAQLSQTLLADPVTETFTVSHAIPDFSPSAEAEATAEA